MSDRLSELKKFWIIAKQVGETYAYDVVEGLYRHRSLRKLTIDELVTVVSVLQEKSGVRLRSRKKKTYLTKKFFQEAGYEVNISNPQRNLISVLYDQAGVTKSHFLQILKHVAPEGYLGPKQAGKVIGALKGLIERGKVDKPAPVVISESPSQEGSQKVRIDLKGFILLEHLQGNG